MKTILLWAWGFLIGFLGGMVLRNLKELAVLAGLVDWSIVIVAFFSILIIVTLAFKNKTYNDHGKPF